MGGSDRLGRSFLVRFRSNGEHGRIRGSARCQGVGSGDRRRRLRRWNDPGCAHGNHAPVRAMCHVRAAVAPITHGRSTELLPVPTMQRDMDVPVPRGVRLIWRRRPRVLASTAPSGNCWGCVFSRDQTRAVPAGSSATRSRCGGDTSRRPFASETRCGPARGSRCRARLD